MNRRALMENSLTVFSKNIPCAHLKVWQIDPSDEFSGMCNYVGTRTCNIGFII